MTLRLALIVSMIQIWMDRMVATHIFFRNFHLYLPWGKWYASNLTVRNGLVKKPTVCLAFCKDQVLDVPPPPPAAVQPQRGGVLCDGRWQLFLAWTTNARVFSEKFSRSDWGRDFFETFGWKKLLSSNLLGLKIMNFNAEL